MRGRERHREIHRARLLGVRERDGREVRVGLLLLLHDRGCVEARRSRAPAAPRCRRRRAAACRPCAGRAVRRPRGRPRCRGSGRRCPRRASRHGLAGVRPARRPVRSAAGYVGQRTDSGDARGDLRVGRRHDLAAVAEVDLVAVVLRRVVTGGDHHPGHAAQLADREGQQRRRQRPRHDESAQSRAGHHLGCVASEHVGVVAGVVPDHHGCSRRSAGVLEVRREAGRRAGDDDAVHPVGTGPQRAAEARRAELQRAGEAVGQLVGLSVAAISASSSAFVSGSGSSAAHARARSIRSLMDGG